MTIKLVSSAAARRRLGRRVTRVSRLAVAGPIVAIAVSGCGGGSSKSSSSSSSSSSSTVPAAPQPLSKAAYEQRLGPLLNDQVVPALRAALASGGAAIPQKVTDAISSLQTAHDQMAALTPPTEVADLQKQAIAGLASMINDATKLRDAENSHDSAATASAAKALKGDGQQPQSVGSQFTSRGY